MKKINVIVFLVALICMSCDDFIPPACEKNHTGEVILTNKGVLPVWVDVTYSDLKRNKLQYLGAYKSITYEMRFGEVFCIGYPVGMIDTIKSYSDLWFKEREYVAECMKLEHIWWFGTKK
jgi:hypothetical protein